MGCARKVDPSIWSILFEHSGSPITLFEVHQLPCAGERERVCVCVCVCQQLLFNVMLSLLIYWS